MPTLGDNFKLINVTNIAPTKYMLGSGIIDFDTCEVTQSGLHFILVRPSDKMW